MRTISVRRIKQKPNTTLVRRIKSNPFSYMQRAVNPFYWVKRVSTHFARREARHEVDRVFLLLIKMYQDQSQAWLLHRNLKLSEILAYASQHCRYYRRLFEQFDIDPRSLCNFKRLPLLDKTIIRAYREDIITDEINRLDHVIMNTGGSTGEPLEFPVSYLAGQIDCVHQEVIFRMMGYEPGDKIFAFDGVSVPDNLRQKHIYWVDTSPVDIPYGRLSYSSLYLSEETMPFYIKHLLYSKAAILRGYPSFLNDISDYILKNNISIPFPIKGVQLTAENVYDWQVENIKRAFSTKICLQYGHSEESVYGYTVDNTYEYICSPFYGLVEVLDSGGMEVHKGETGEVVVTGFYNYALPFIRYRTGDMAVFNGDENGIVKLGKIVGRTQDYVYTKDSERVALTALIFGQHYRAFRNIRKWQLVQNTPGKIVVKIVKGERFSDEDENEIRGKFKSICNIDIDFDFVVSIPLTTKRGKFKFLVQNIEF